ncbi:MAG TPA: chemotaxis protein CheW [Acidobacteriota bacterium]|nr:chemotaxis protein CheW [Acidobacteriota bacterium]HQQ46353.1 chemotaxis protein CheW [Acidobacteriota bacterium]
MDLAKIRKKAKKKEHAAPESIRKPRKEKDPAAVEAKPAVEAPETEPVRERRETQSGPGPAESYETAAPAASSPRIEVPVKIETPSQPEPELQKGRDKKLEKLLVFRVGRNRYAIPIDDLSQIIDDRILTPLPHVPPFLKGIFSLRGHIVGVLDVSERLKLPPLPESILKKIVVIEKGSDLFGLRVENIEHVVEVDLSSLEAPPESFDAAQQEFVMGVFHFRKKTVAFLNIQQFLEFDVAGRN